MCYHLMSSRGGVCLDAKSGSTYFGLFVVGVFHLCLFGFF